MPHAEPGGDPGRTREAVVFLKRRSAALYVVVVIAYLLLEAVWIVRDPYDRGIAWVDFSPGLARAVGIVAVPLLAIGLIRGLESLLPRAPAVVLTDAGIRSHASNRWFPPHPFAAWDEIVGVRLNKGMFGIDRIVLDLRGRRPIKIFTGWLSDTDAARLRQELSARLIGRGPSPD